MNNKIRHIVLNTTAASAGDLIVDDQEAYIQKYWLGKPKDFLGRHTRKETAITAETLGVITLTPTGAANSLEYGIQLTQLNPGATGTAQKQITKNITVTTPATGAVSATTICDQFKNEYFNVQSTFNVTVNATGAGTLVITAVAGSPFIFAKWLNLGGGASTDLVNTTAGIDTRGTPTDMQALGVSSSLTTGTGYTLYSFRSLHEVGESNRSVETQYEDIYLWLNESMTNYAALITRLDQFVAALGSGGAFDPEIIGVDQGAV